MIVSEQNSATLRDYLSGFNIDAPIYPDIEGSIVKTLNLKTIPAAIYVNVKGKIEGFYEGTLTQAETKQLTAALASGKSVPRLTVAGGVGSPAIDIANIQWKDNKNNLLIFHSTSCRFCEEELPYLLKYAEENPSISITVIARGPSEEADKQFAKAPKNVKIIGETKKVDISSIATKYRVNGTPTQILVNDKGVITWRAEGFDAKGHNPFLGNSIPLNK